MKKLGLIIAICAMIGSTYDFWSNGGWSTFSLTHPFANYSHNLLWAICTVICFIAMLVPAKIGDALIKILMCWIIKVFITDEENALLRESLILAHHTYFDAFRRSGYKEENLNIRMNRFDQIKEELFPIRLRVIDK